MRGNARKRAKEGRREERRESAGKARTRMHIAIVGVCVEGRAEIEAEASAEGRAVA
jgi:hypothetical protein